MPLFLTVVKDTSPLLVYSSSWQAGLSETDGSLDQYTQSSFTDTQVQGSSVTFRFYGSFVGVYGAKRGNHGNYQVSLDGTITPTLNGESNPALFNQTLFSQGMPLGFHNLTVANKQNSFFDIDYVAFDTTVGLDNEPLVINAYQDSHPAFSYTPPSAWYTAPNNVGTFSGGSGQVCIRHIDIPSDAIALYGPVGPNVSTSYAVRVDNGSPTTFSASKQFYRPQQILFYAGNLGPGQHTLQVQVGESSTGEFAIDYANVFSAPSLGGSFLSANVLPESNHLPSGTVAALAITTTLAILSSLLALYLFWRQRRGLLHYGLKDSLKSTISLEDPRPYPFTVTPTTENNLAVQSTMARYVSNSTSPKPYPLTTKTNVTSPPSFVGSPIDANSNVNLNTAPAPVPQVPQAGSNNGQESLASRNEKGRVALNSPQRYNSPQSLGAGLSTPYHNPPPEYSYDR
ncbi:hypothetical protein CPB84DRAFT_384909 [Gymnopilus junonius]|uniref:Transmembrane protein n=1 Tax=Gymnopilus junonius TaxID=109634 RepID=A0A9P5TH19_GYMJU|nr:hypothetical protein CPB84DRAFT_384909 [Gymnopilus junonius]